MKWWLKIILYEITSKLFFFYLNFQKLQYLNAVKCHLMELLILCHLSLRLVLIRYCIILKQCNLTTMGSVVTFSEKNTIYIVKFNRKKLLVKVKVKIVRYYKLCITALNIWSVAFFVSQEILSVIYDHKLKWQKIRDGYQMCSTSLLLNTSDYTWTLQGTGVIARVYLFKQICL